MHEESQRFRRLPFRLTVVNTHITLVGRCFIPGDTAVDPVFASTSGSMASGLAPRRLESFTQPSMPNLGKENPLVIAVHQWSKMGGDSTLMDGIAIRLAVDHRIPAVTFDLRGVGESSGRSTLRALDEVRDVVAVCEWAVSTLNARSIFLLGSSAGAPVAGSAIDLVEEVRGFIGVGYVFGFAASWIFGCHYKAMMNSSKPKLLIHGDKDGFTAMKTFSDYFHRMKEPKEKLVVSNVGHFELEAPHYDRLIVNRTTKFIQKCMGGICGRSPRAVVEAPPQQRRSHSGGPMCISASIAEDPHEEPHEEAATH